MAGSQIIAERQSLACEPAGLRARIGAMDLPAFCGGPAGVGPSGRWAILAARPRLVFESVTGFDWRIQTAEGWNTFAGDALAGLGTVLDRYGLGGCDHGLDAELPFQGGLIGFLSYDLAPLIERVPRRIPTRDELPLIRFGLYDTFVLIDHDRDRATLWAVDLLAEGRSATRDRLDRWAADLAKPPPPRIALPALRPIVPDQTASAYRAGVEQARRYIAAGDIFQVNLAQRFVTSGAVDGLALDARLQAVSPAPYSAFLSWPGHAILSASPELFYETQGRTIRTRPIKGTRPRAVDPDTDRAMVAELIASPKELAELTMIVDLERNDLGRVCEFGSIRVSEPRSVESYRNVHHTVATVEGRLRADVDPIGIVRALFPGGSITGAPKIRAMEIIDELEPCRRGVYTGSIGYWSANGRSAFNIAIRTVVVAGTEISYHVGGGIVIESDPEQEYQETLAKGRGLLATLNNCGGAS